MVGEIEEEEDEFDAPLPEDEELPEDDELSEDEELSDELSEEQMDDFETDVVELEDDVDVSPKERADRALEIRRALEVRDEQRRLSEDLDYLDFDD